MIDEYDYIIVGAGSAGCVIADRLSADADAQVLLVEAGGSDAAPQIQDGQISSLFELWRRGWQPTGAMSHNRRPLWVAAVSPSPGVRSWAAPAR